MTIVTKPLSEKKGEKPLVDDVRVDVVPERPQCQGVPLMRSSDVRGLGREREVQSASTACLFLAALVVLSLGIITGSYWYQKFVRSQMEKFHVSCDIPFVSLQRQRDQLIQSLQNDMAIPSEDMDKAENYFHEDFEIDDNCEKISVPDFSGGRRSKFIHDFKVNKTGIIDIDGSRCFIMPLNRTLVLPPDTLMDLVRKMREGYYEVDTSYVRDTMQVVTPPIEDRASIGHYIEQECYGYPIYKLEKIVSGVFKRSAEPEIKFTEFAGMKTHELSIVNYKQLQEHEEQLPQVMA